MTNSGSILKMLRVYHSKSAGELSEELGISTGYLSELENSKKEPSLKLIQKYAQVFGTRPSVILALMERSQSSSFIGKLKQATTSMIMSALEKLATENETDIPDSKEPILETEQ